MAISDPQRIREIQREGSRAYGDFGVDAARFAAQLRKRWAQREPAKPALADVYLAICCSEGSERAWAVLARTFTPLLEATARRRGEPPSEASEIAADILADLKLDTYDGSGSLAGWFAVIVYRRVADRVRRRKLPQALPVHEIEGPAVDPGRAVEESEDTERAARALRTAWATLTPRERQAMLLVYGQDLKQRDVARLMAVVPSRVTALLRNGIARLQTSIEETLQPSEQSQVGHDLLVALASLLDEEIPGE